VWLLLQQLLLLDAGRMVADSNLSSSHHCAYPDIAAAGVAGAAAAAAD
jgi:hypothetical protein